VLRVLSCLTTEHDFGLVLVAGIVCLLSMVTAFLLAAQIGEMRAKRRLRWLAALGFVSGGGIWATHFIAMLAYQPHLPTAYDPLRTVLSIGVGVLASSLAWRAFFARSAIWRWAAPAVFAIGVAAMHKTGMTALQTTGRITYDGAMIAGSVAVGIVFSYAGFHLAKLRWRRIPILPALGLVLAICAIHFGAMAAVTIYPESGLTIDPSTIESGDAGIADRDAGSGDPGGRAGDGDGRSADREPRPARDGPPQELQRKRAGGTGDPGERCDRRCQQYLLGAGGL
jgi:NO-binding membrane sensor protein with MHYT domain